MRQSYRMTRKNATTSIEAYNVQKKGEGISMLSRYLSGFIVRGKNILGYKGWDQLQYCHYISRPSI